ncbi:MAG TPA: HAD family hydrolase [Rectinemataceae bacterium]|nr:HAD family hydrolase [Rectinemataceae bacterium]
MKHDSSLARRALSARKKVRQSRPRGRECPRKSAAACLLALDSDGTVFDSMRAKHERCFMPAFAAFFGSGAERACLDEVWRFVNLGSRLRGANRYAALAAALRIGSRHPRIGSAMRRWEGTVGALEAWLAQESAPSKSRLELALDARRADRLLALVLAWSHAVDEAIAGLPSVPPFRGAVAALPLLAAGCEIMVLTSAPAAAIVREWEEAGLAPYAARVVGQERGRKAACLAAAMEGRFEAGRVLVVGDAPGDLEAARAVGAQFFPILHGREEESWKSFSGEFLPGFLAGRPVISPIATFLESLPANPSWL